MSSFGVNYVYKKGGLEGGDYVYYERLNSDADIYNRPELRGLYQTNINRFENYVGSLSAANGAYQDVQRLRNFFIDMAELEFSKEKQVLTEVFNCNINYDYRTNGLEAGKNLILAFNKKLQLDRAVQRSYALITQTQGQKDLIVYFPSYFEDTLTTFLTNGINSGIIDITDEASIKSFIDNNTPDMVKETLIYMFSSTEVQNGIKEQYEGLRDCYEPLIDLIQSQSGNEIIQGFIETYDLKELGDEISSVIVSSNKINISENKVSFRSNVHSKGGNAKEWMENMVIKVATSQIKGSNVEVIHTGASGVKADNQIVINMNIGNIEEAMSDYTGIGREKSVQITKKLQRLLENQEEGYIISSSDKEYTLNKDFHGYEANNQALGAFANTWELMGVDEVSARPLIYMILQTIPGAVGYSYKNQVQEALSTTIGAELFDDYESNFTNSKTGGGIIHLLNLNGVQVPMSFFYYLMSEAFNEFSNISMADLVGVNISTPSSIMFPTMEDQRGVFDAWRRQSSDALKAIRITHKFFEKYKEIMTSLNLNFL